MKKPLALFMAFILSFGLLGCGKQSIVYEDVLESSYEYESSAEESETQASIITTDEIESSTETIITAITKVNSETLETQGDNNTLKTQLTNPVWQKYFDESKTIRFMEKFLFVDINNDEIFEMICISASSTTLAYYHNDTIKELSSNQYWGDGCVTGGMPFYYDKIDGTIMTTNSNSNSEKYNFYDYVNGDYHLSHELSCIEKIVPWEIDKWIKSPNLDVLLDAYDMSFEELKELENGELLGIAWDIGYFDRVNQYIIDDIEVSGENWQNTIDEFKNAPDCITLCTRNSDLSFIGLGDMNGDFTNYIKEKYFN